MELFVFGIALVIYFVLHSVLAHQIVKAYLFRWIGKRYYRIFFNLVAVATLIALYFFYKRVTPQLLFELEWIKILGAGFVVIGFIISVFALLQYNLSEFSGTQQFRKKTPPAPEVLQIKGLNAYVRHPLYFSILVIAWGYFLFRPTDLVLTVALVSTIYIYFGIRLEEQKLIEEFGEAYLEYQKKVGMLFPF